MAIWSNSHQMATKFGGQWSNSCRLRAGVSSLSTDVSMLHVSPFPTTSPCTATETTSWFYGRCVLPCTGRTASPLPSSSRRQIPNLVGITPAQGCRECLLQMRAEIGGKLLPFNDAASSSLRFGSRPDTVEDFGVRFSFLLWFL